MVREVSPLSYSSIYSFNVLLRLLEVNCRQDGMQIKARAEKAVK
jgi:hypothetical protein